VIALLKSAIGPLLRADDSPPNLPQGAVEVEVFRASGKYLTYRFLRAGLMFGVLQTAALFAAAGVWFALARKGAEGGSIVLAVFFGASLVLWAVAALVLVAIQLDYDYHHYVLTDRSLRIRRGIWTQIEATLTYANVQNVRVIQGPIERMFGFAAVVVDTAGSGSSEEKDPLMLAHRGVIRGIENAPLLREKIMGHLRTDKTSGLGDLDDVGHVRVTEELPGSERMVGLLAEVRDEARGLAAALRRR
jgi:membrane protein YdbS with pleckstrin-like domain